MVEFGAGGKVGRRGDEPVAAGPAGEEVGNGTNANPPEGTTGPANPQVAGGTTTTGRERRKKKAKGWYCPVCRQRQSALDGHSQIAENLQPTPHCFVSLYLRR